MTPDARTLRTIGQLSTIGLAFVFAIVLGFAGGYWIDRWLGTAPWFSLLGFAVGLAGGAVQHAHKRHPFSGLRAEDSRPQQR